MRLRHPGNHLFSLLKKQTVWIKVSKKDLIYYCKHKHCTWGESARSLWCNLVRNAKNRNIVQEWQTWRMGTLSTTYPENYLFSLPKKILSGSKYPKTFYLISEHKHCTLTMVEPCSQCQENKRFAGVTPVKFFSKLKNLFFGYFDPINNFFDDKNK